MKALIPLVFVVVGEELLDGLAWRRGLARFHEADLNCLAREQHLAADPDEMS